MIITIVLLHAYLFQSLIITETELRRGFRGSYPCDCLEAWVQAQGRHAPCIMYVPPVIVRDQGCGLHGVAVAIRAGNSLTHRFIEEFL